MKLQINNLVNKSRRMTLENLEFFNDLPFLVFIKDEKGRYVWTNQAVTQLAKKDITGKTDLELMSVEYANALRQTDQKVWETEETHILEEKVEAPEKGTLMLNVCKFTGDLDGKKCLFGIAFMMNQT